MSGIFISHTHVDKDLSAALKTLARALFGADFPVKSSTDKEFDGGVAPGDNWFQWIVDQVRHADIALILLTPSSIQKPWVIWEGGAVAGAAFATSGDDNASRVLPIAYGIRSSDVPSPFAQTQILTGTDEADIKKLVYSLYVRFGKNFTPAQSFAFGDAQPTAIRHYLDQAHKIVLKLPLVITEGAIQEWLVRLDELEKENRFSEAVVMENWLDVAFGRDEEDQKRAIDVRIHRRLGEMYAASGQASDAARQFELARQLVPRDIYILRRLGKAHLDKKDPVATRAVLDAIKEFAPKTYDVNVENAALLARYYEATNNREGARDVLEKAFDNNPSSYYLGDRLGQTLIALGEKERAREIYVRVLRILADLGEQNVWTYATALTASIVREDVAGTQRWLEALRELRPTRGELDTIEGAATRLVTNMNGDLSILAPLRAMKQERAPA